MKINNFEKIKDVWNTFQQSPHFPSFIFPICTAVDISYAKSPRSYLMIFDNDYRCVIYYCDITNGWYFKWVDAGIYMQHGIRILDSDMTDIKKVVHRLYEWLLLVTPVETIWSRLVNITD